MLPTAARKSSVSQMPSKVLRDAIANDPLDHKESLRRGPISVRYRATGRGWGWTYWVQQLTSDVEKNNRLGPYRETQLTKERIGQRPTVPGHLPLGDRHFPEPLTRQPGGLGGRPRN